MKIIAPMIAFVLISTSIAAQNFIGVKLGPSLTGTQVKGYDSRVRFVGGVTFDHQLNKASSIGADLLLNQRGFQTDLTFSTGPDPQDATPTKIKFNVNYLSIPLKYSAQFGNDVKFFGSVAAIPSFLLNAQSKMPVFSTPGASPSGTIGGDADISKDTNKFDFAAQLEAGLNYSFTEKYIGLISLAYQRSLTSMFESEYYLTRKGYSSSLILSVGMKMKLAN